MSSQQNVATDIPTRHKAGIWGGGAIAIIALIVGIVALCLALLYWPQAATRWATTTVTPSGGTASVSISNRTIFEVAGPSDNSKTVAVSLTDGHSGDLFGIANTAATNGGSLIVSVTSGSVEIFPGTGVQFVKSTNRIVPFGDLVPIVQSS